MYVQSLPDTEFGRWKYPDIVAPGHTEGIIRVSSLSVGCNWSELKNTVAVFCTNKHSYPDQCSLQIGRGFVRFRNNNPKL